MKVRRNKAWDDPNTYNINEAVSILVDQKCYREDQLRTLQNKCDMYEEIIGRTLELLVGNAIFNLDDISQILGTKLEEVS